jgi:hypothetical protein
VAVQPTTVTDPAPPDLPPTVEETAAPKKRLTRRRILLWLTMAFVVTLLLAGIVIYFERISIVEGLFRDALEDRGLEAELQVESLSTEGLVLTEITLRENGVIVLQADKISAGYVFREALNGRIREMEIDRARIRVGVNEDFQIVEGWLKPSGDGGGGTVLPYEGVTLNDSAVDLITPYGDLDIGLEGEIAAVERFDLDIALAPTTLTYENYTATVEGVGEGTLTRDGDNLNAAYALRLPTASGPDLDLSDANLTFDIEYDIPTKILTGPINSTVQTARFRETAITAITLSGSPQIDLTAKRLTQPLTLSAESVTSPTVEATSLTLASDNPNLSWADGLTYAGDYTLESDTLSGFDMRTQALKADVSLPDPGTSTGQLDLTAERFSFTPNRARQLASSLALEDRLSTLPVARDFHPQLVESVTQTLRGGALDLSADFNLLDTYTLTLTEPATLRGANSLRITPIPDQPIYRFDPSEGRLALRLNAALTGERGLRMDDLTLRALSENGASIDAVEGFSARARLSDWAAITPEGRPTTLPALDIRIDSTPEGTAISGPFTYTGDIPGGYVTNLQTGGALRITPADQTQIDFAPNAPVAFDTLLLPSGARVEDFSATLTSTDPVLTGDAQDGTILATLAEPRFRFLFEREDGTPERMDVTLATLNAEGALQGDVQDWNMQVTDLDVSSDTFIGQGTHISAPDALLSARLETGAPLTFTFDTDSLDAQTALADAMAMPVSLDGTLEAFDVEYGPGGLELKNDSVPPTTVEGTAIFAGGEWVGEALAELPGNQFKPLDVTFQFQDGLGVADVVIEDLYFDPEGGLQPQDYLPALRGKISQVFGNVDGAFTIEFGVDKPLDGKGYILLDGLDMGTAPGPAQGIRSRIEFESLFPLKTTGRQTLTMESFDPGLPLNNGTFDFELIPEGIKIYSAKWPLGDGQIDLEPLTWTYGAEVNRAVLVIDDVSMQAFLDNFGQDDVKISGILKGRLPVEIRGINVEVKGGRLEVPNGGIIQYETPQTDTAAAQDALTQVAFTALREFEYQRLGLDIDGPFDGEVTVFIGFLGSLNAEARDVFTDKLENDSRSPLPGFVTLKGDVPFEFNISITGELFNILRSFDPNTNTQSVIDQARDQILRNQGIITE